MMKLLLPSLFMTTVISVTPSKFVWLAGVVFLALATFMMLMNNVIFFDLEYMGYSVSYSSLSYYLVILSVWISLVMILSSFKIMKMNEFSSLFSFLIMFLMLVLLFTFTTNSSLLFYFFFEASLIPTLIIIMGWGYQPERLQAGLYFLFYTLTASLPLLLTILFLSVKFNSMVFYLWGVNFLSLINMGNLNMFLILGLALAFLVKLPMFFTHLWLPKAHVEAPVAGSMILAGVLLKLGGYGLMCVAPVLILFSSSVNGYVIGLSLAGMLFVGFICLRLNDFKALVAYSSVAHMGMVISGILSFYIWGFNGGVVMMLAHGLSSSGLFSIVNMYYERLGSRSFFINKGLLLVFPLLSLFMFLLTSANMAAPPTMNLMSEIFLMGSIMGFDLWMLLLFPLGSFMGAVFSLFMFSFSQHGKLYNMLYSVNYNDSREFHILFLHIMPVNFLILNSVLFMMVS